MVAGGGRLMRSATSSTEPRACLTYNIKAPPYRGQRGLPRSCRLRAVLSFAPARSAERVPRTLVRVASGVSP